MDYISIIIWISVCIFIAVGIYMMVQITKGINRQIKKCDEIGEWAKAGIGKASERGGRMSREEAIKVLTNEKRYVFADSENDKALDMAIRSLEACKQIQAMVFNHLGDWDSDADEVIISIKDVLKEVEE